MLTQDLLNELFEYCDGNLYWKVSKTNQIKQGDKAGFNNFLGYCVIKINSKAYKAHRLIYIMHYGENPKIIDHIDNNPFNNKIENLRAATKIQNGYNAKIRRDNSSGIKGVGWAKRVNKWCAYCTVNKKQHHLGFFDDIKEAEKVVKKFRELHHKEFARQN